MAIIDARCTPTLAVDDPMLMLGMPQVSGPSPLLGTGGHHEGAAGKVKTGPSAISLFLAPVGRGWH